MRRLDGPAPSDEPPVIAVGDLLRSLAGRWRLVVTAIGASLLAALVVVAVSEPLYEARMTVMRTPGTASGGGISLSGLGGLGGLAGAALGKDDGQSPFGQFRRVLQSGALAERLEARHGLLKRVFADRFDSATGRFLPPQGVKAAISRAIGALFGLPDPAPPRAAIDLAAVINDQLTITADPGGAYLTLSYRHPDPEFASFMLRALYAEADALIREREHVRIEGNLSYLRERFEATSNVLYRSIFVDELASLERQRMVLQNEAAYAAAVFDGPIDPIQPSHPRPLLYGAIALAGGAVLGLLAAILHVALAGERGPAGWPGVRLLARLKKGWRHGLGRPGPRIAAPGVP